jgi:hypothetical protein
MTLPSRLEIVEELPDLPWGASPGPNLVKLWAGW